MPELMTLEKGCVEPCRKCGSTSFNPVCAECREIRDLSFSFGVSFPLGEGDADAR